MNCYRNQPIHQLPHIFSVSNQLVFSNCLLCYIFEMSDRIHKLICQRGLSAEKQQEVVGLIGSASKAELEYKVSPKQQHLSLFIVFDLVLIASFHFYFFTHLGLGWECMDLPSLCYISWICFHDHRPAEEGGGHQCPKRLCKYGFIEFHVFGVECCCVGGVGDDCSSLGSLSGT